VTEETDAPPCAEKRRLLELFEAQTTAFATAVVTLNRRIGNTTHAAKRATQGGSESEPLPAENPRC